MGGHDGGMFEDHEACVRAVRSNDRRFDGVFFTGVTSTGIYCRPSCPARTPKVSNMVFFPSAAAAQVAGFRACLRCFPDDAPDSPVWRFASVAAARAVALINEGVVDREGVPGLAARLGYSVRHTQRLFAAELGAGPLDVARAVRARTARVLLRTSSLPVSQVAFAAGFESIRSFNETIRRVYGVTPTVLRGKGVAGGVVSEGVSGEVSLSVVLPVRLPFSPSNLFGHLAACAVPGVEEWRAGAFRRSLRLAYGVGVGSFRPEPQGVRASFLLSDARDVGEAIQVSKRLFDTAAEPVAVDADLSRDPVLAPVVAGCPGRRVSRSVCAAEVVLRTVIGQQVSTAGAATVTGRLVAAVGDSVVDAQGGLLWLFPTPDAVAGVDPGVLAMPSARKETLLRVAEALASGELDVAGAVSSARVREQLLAVKGVGPWTADMVLMRAVGDPDVFLPGDLGVRQAAGVLGLPSGVKALGEYARRWSPWRSYAVQYLWATGDHPVNFLPRDD